MSTTSTIDRMFVGIDTNNIIAQNVTSYTPNQDCWAVVGGNAGQVDIHFYIDGVEMPGQFYETTQANTLMGIYPIKAGQVLTTYVNGSSGWCIFTLYGLKY